MSQASATTTATLHDLKKLSGGVWMVQLKPLTPYSYCAGQFTELMVPGFNSLYYTIASSPSSPCVELHIQSGTDQADALIDYLKDADSVELASAGGDCRLEVLPDEDGPLLLIASGTGFSQVKSIVEDLLSQHTRRSIHLYWSGHRLSQLYMLQKAENWADLHDNIHVSALISEHSHWDDKHQMLVHSILGDHSDLNQCQAICCGSPAMVYTVLDSLCSKGFRRDAMLSDVFMFSPEGGPMNTADVLQIFGLEPRETRLYLALLQSGPASIRDIADRAGINRGTTHELLKRMQQKGVVSYFPKGKRRHFSAEPPQRLRELALNHQQQVTEALELLDDKVIPELSHLRPATGNADVHYYEGDDGIELVLKDILSTVSEQENRSYCIYSAKAIRKYLYRPFPNYTRQRVKMGIKVKVIAIGEGGEEAALADRKWINEPSSDRAGSYIAIYPPKMAMISLSHGDLPTAVVINSPTIANTQQVIFNTLWESL